MMIRKKYLIVIGGATASGKTSVAIELAKHFSTVILSCDSRQFYREMSIGTAKPTSDELMKAKHYFIDSLSIHESYSVGDYERDAINLLDKIYATNDLAILVGGSGLFIQAVCEGLNHYPDVPETVKQELEKIYQEKGIEALREELEIADPEYYKKVDLNNVHRLLRALSICRVSRKPFSSFQKVATSKRNFTPIYLLMQWEREELYRRINQRVDQMLVEGLEAEAESLVPHQHLNALQTVGYQELFDYFNHKVNREEAIRLIKRNSRRYAKRQMTWFRRNEAWKPFYPNQVNKMIEYVEQKMRKPYHF